jgi:hypothetical protein
MSTTSNILSHKTNDLHPAAGVAPNGVKRIIARSATDIPKDYVSWATHYALLDDKFIAQITNCPTRETVLQLVGRGWAAMPGRGWYGRAIGNYYLSVDPGTLGWGLQRYHKRTSDVLTIDNIPILCPSAMSGVQLIEACYPGAKHPFRWLDASHPFPGKDPAIVN